MPTPTDTGPLPILAPKTFEPVVPPAPAGTVYLPWYRESAFKAWVKKSTAALGAVLIAISSNALPENVTWWGALLAAAIYSAGDLALSAYDIWFGGPDVFQPPPPPSQEEQIKALQAQVAALSVKPPTP